MVPIIVVVVLVHKLLPSLARHGFKQLTDSPIELLQRHRLRGLQGPIVRMFMQHHHILRQLQALMHAVDGGTAPESLEDRNHFVGGGTQRAAVGRGEGGRGHGLIQGVVQLQIERGAVLETLRIKVAEAHGQLGLDAVQRGGQLCVALHLPG